MADWRESIKAVLLDYLTDPLMMIVFGIIVIVMAGFITIIVSIRIRDRSGLVKPGTRASQVPGVKWPDPIRGRITDSQLPIIDTPERRHPRVTKIVFYPTEFGHTVRNGPDEILRRSGIDITESVESVTIGEDTPPIEVIKDAPRAGEASDRPEHAEGLQGQRPEDREVSRALRAQAASRSRARRSTGRSRRRRPGADQP